MTFKVQPSFPIRTQRTGVTPEQKRHAYLRLAHEHGYDDGVSGKLRTSASYFANEDAEAIGEYRKGLRIGRRERARSAA